MGAPERLVEIEGVLLDSAVQGDKSLVVPSGGAALVSGRAAEIEHVPDVGGPQIRPLHEDSCHVFVVFGLVALRVIPAFRFVRLPGDNALRPVFRQAQADIGVLFMKIIQPFFVFGVVSPVPAKIVIVAFQIGDPVEGTLGGEHADVGDGGQAGGIQLFYQGVQVSVVFHQAGFFAGDGDLIGDAPEADGGMIVILTDQILHLEAAVVMGGRILTLAADIRDFRPDHKAVFVTGVIEISAVLVVGQADGVGAQLRNQGSVLIVFFSGEGVSLPESVLVSGDAPQHERLSVQEEALLRIHGEKADAEAGSDLIRDLVAKDQRRGTSVQIRVFHTLPQMGRGEQHLCPGAFRWPPDFSHLPSLGVRDKVADGVIRGSRCDAAVQVDQSAVGGAAHVAAGGAAHGLRRIVGQNAAVDDLGGHRQAGRAVEADVKVCFRQDQQVYPAVQAAVEGKVSHLGINVALGRIVRQYGESVGFPGIRVLLPGGGGGGAGGAERLGDIGDKGGIAALVAAQLPPVDDNRAA